MGTKRNIVMVAVFLLAGAAGTQAGTIYGPGPGGAIPDSASVTSDIVVADTGTILAFNSITIEGLSHTWIGDLQASLTHVDTGTSVTLFDRPGVPASFFGNSADFTGGNVTFSDAGASPVPVVGSVGTATFYASLADDVTQTFLSAFTGQTVNGTWRLEITDNAGSDIGSFNGFSFDVDTTRVSSVPVPAAAWMGLALLGGLAIVRRRR